MNLKQVRSRPSRARGLKLRARLSLDQQEEVAPLAGAWIETLLSVRARGSSRVAPLAGAWIETKAVVLLIRKLCGRAPRGRVD